MSVVTTAVVDVDVYHDTANCVAVVKIDRRIDDRSRKGTFPVYFILVSFQLAVFIEGHTLQSIT